MDVQQPLVLVAFLTIFPKLSKLDCKLGKFQSQFIPGSAIFSLIYLLLVRRLYHLNTFKFYFFSDVMITYIFESIKMKYLIEVRVKLETRHIQSSFYL